MKETTRCLWIFIIFLLFFYRQCFHWLHTQIYLTQSKCGAHFMNLQFNRRLTISASFLFVFYFIMISSHILFSFAPQFILFYNNFYQSVDYFRCASEHPMPWLYASWCISLGMKCGREKNPHIKLCIE